MTDSSTNACQILAACPSLSPHLNSANCYSGGRRAEQWIDQDIRTLDKIYWIYQLSYNILGEGDL